MFTVVVVVLIAGVWGLMDGQGPLLVLEPPPRLEFSNSTGGRLDCSARGSPKPTVHWLLVDGTPASSISRLRYQLPNGSLTFPAFSAAEFRPDVHRAVYRCVASNALGRVLSRDVRLRAGMHTFRQYSALECTEKYNFIIKQVALTCTLLLKDTVLLMV
jgi:hypothetical protein